ncbi:MAG: SMI1/KNR4 family protein [bacterium]
MREADWREELGWIARAGWMLQKGLGDAEIAAVETHYGFHFPPDLRSFLTAAVPHGERFPNWRNVGSEELRQTLAWPADSICFDIEHNDFWWPAWGARPANLRDAVELALARLSEAPRLVPVYAHRYLPSEPWEAGNPVFSVYQTDIILYGADLRAYLACEFGLVPHQEAIAGSLKRVPFWSDVVQYNAG